PRGIELSGQLRERERDALLLEDRPAERLTLGRPIARELERGARDAERLSRNHRPGLLEGAERRGAAAAVRCARGLEAPLEPPLASEQVVCRDAAVLERDLRGVRRAAAELLELAHQLEPRRTARHHEQ